jgi:hypothetical protein
MQFSGILHHADWKMVTFVLEAMQFFETVVTVWN